MINAGATFIAGFVSIGVFYLMKRRSLQASWGDMRSGIFMLLVRMGVHALAGRKKDERTWRPNILVMSGSPTSRWHLIELADAISQGRGFLTLATVVPEDAGPERIEQMSDSIDSYLQKRGVSGLTRVFPAPSPLEGMQALVKAYGFGPIVPNTILLGETQQKENFAGYARLLQAIQRRRQNLVIVRESEDLPPQFVEGTRIDVWTTENPQNRGFMLALAYLLNRSAGWRKSKLMIKTIVDSDAEREGAEVRLGEFIERSRLEATAQVIMRRSDGIFPTIRAESQGADIVFLGIRAPVPDERPEDYAKYYETLLANTDNLPPTALVLATETIDFSAIFEE